MSSDTDPSQISSGKTTLYKLSFQLAVPVEFYIVEGCAEGEDRRIPEAVPVYILPRLGIPVQAYVFGFIRFCEEVLPLHAQ